MNGRRILGIPINGRKDKDEELLLFKELHNREERILSLLQPVSEEFELHAAASGNYPIYRIPSAKKGPGFEFLADQNGKNDYDWLKTPPATPLFPSLEMEAPAPELVIQREIPIVQPFSRFAADNSEAPKASNGRPKSPRPNTKLPLRSTTPSQRPSILPTEPITKSTRGTPIINYQKPVTDISKRTNRFTNTAKSTNQKEIHMDSLASNQSKKMGTDSRTKPRSRGVSPLVRSKIPAQIPEFSNETPHNLRTDRSSTSAARGRLGNPIHSVHHKPEPSIKPRRDSCSPSVMRGRKVESKQESSSQGNVTAQKGGVLTGNGTHVFGSRMVDKVMNARKSGAEGRETKPKSRGLINESSDFGMMTSKSSLDIKFKHMEIKRDQVNSSNLSVVPGSRRSSRRQL
ncbi:uncharacterized protein LOC133857674 [Alnus glutinosa]|uniref:uncharacterized protein LOC133857674 n=1 Tax=Alnus glutinosa TaxID=3517 RepID=UPI002D772CE5|nr:uncharacterized protein LOC133857674 [Alnus glutinosa]